MYICVYLNTAHINQETSLAAFIEVWCNDTPTVAAIKGFAIKGKWLCYVICFHLINRLMFLLSQWNSLCLGLAHCLHAAVPEKEED